MTISPRPTLSTAKVLLETAQLPVEDLNELHCEHFFFAGEAGAPIGIVGLEIHGDVALLTPNRRRTPRVSAQCIC